MGDREDIDQCLQEVSRVSLSNSPEEGKHLLDKLLCIQGHCPPP